MRALWRVRAGAADDSSGLARLIRAADLHEASATEGLMQTLQRLSTLNGCRPLGEFRAVSQVRACLLAVRDSMSMCACVRVLWHARTQEMRPACYQSRDMLYCTRNACHLRSRTFW